MPVFASSIYLRDLYIPATDLVPQLCKELDIAYPLLMRLGWDIPYYSHRPAIDKVFTEYKCMKDENRIIARTWLLAKTEGRSAQ